MIGDGDGVLDRQEGVERSFLLAGVFAIVGGRLGGVVGEVLSWASLLLVLWWIAGVLVGAVRNKPTAD